MKTPKRFETVWRAKWSCDGCETIDEMVQALNRVVARLRAYERAGITLRGKVQDDYAYLETDDPAVAQEFKLNAVEGEEG